ncbi:hypothetical protein ACFL31_00030 [Candidatus Margulisiibacteriota bacterium]
MGLKANVVTTPPPDPGVVNQKPVKNDRPIREAAAPAAYDPLLASLIVALSEAAGKNVFSGEGPGRPDVGLAAALRRALDDDGKISRSEFESILEEYYDIDNIEDEPWEAFSGGKGKNELTAEELTKCLKFFTKFRSVTAYSLKWFLDCDEVLIAEGADLGKILEARNLTSSSANIGVKEAWEAAKYLTKNKKTKATWDWFATILLAKYMNKLRDEADISVEDLDLQHPMMQQLFRRHVMEWIEYNTRLTDGEWDDLIAAQDAIKSMEATGLVSLRDIKLQDGITETSGLLGQIIKNYGDWDRSTLQQNIGKLRDFQSGQGEASPSGLRLVKSLQPAG